ncbi:MAG: HAD hydrolase-like protein [Clostridia bacterium]|nr:HAD hydrolase-like protein [Clostridia bacterium]
MQKKAVLFDLDGTLVNSIPDISGSVNYAMRAHNLPEHDVKTCMYMVGSGARVLIEKAVGDHQEMVDDVLRTYREHYALHCFDTSHVYEGISEMLSALLAAGYRLVVLSNKDDGDVKTGCSAISPIRILKFCAASCRACPSSPIPRRR